MLKLLDRMGLSASTRADTQSSFDLLQVEHKKQQQQPHGDASVPPPAPALSPQQRRKELEATIERQRANRIDFKDMTRELHDDMMTNARLVRQLRYDLTKRRSPSGHLLNTAPRWDFHTFRELVYAQPSAEEKALMRQEGYRILEFANFDWDYFIEALNIFKEFYGHVDVPTWFTINEDMVPPLVQPKPPPKTPSSLPKAQQKTFEQHMDENVYSKMLDERTLKLLNSALSDTEGTIDYGFGPVPVAKESSERRKKREKDGAESSGENHADNDHQADADTSDDINGDNREDEDDDDDPIPRRFPLFPRYLLELKLGRGVWSVRHGDYDGFEVPERRAVLDALGFDWGNVGVYQRFRWAPMFEGLKIYARTFAYPNPPTDFIVPEEEIFPMWMHGMPLGEWVSAARVQQQMLFEYYPQRVDHLRTLGFLWWIPPDESLPEKYYTSLVQPPRPERPWLERPYPQVSAKDDYTGTF